jgi:hypothetical protein
MFKKLLLICFVCAAAKVSAQGMPIDSLKGRLVAAFGENLVESLRQALPIRYDMQNVWGLAVGDFSNDGKPDLALSLYDIAAGGKTVTVHLLQNEDGERFKPMFSKKYSFVETPIEVGLAHEKYAVYIIQKSDDQHWRQEGYTIYAGDVIALDEFETKKKTINSGAKTTTYGYEVYRSYETLLTTERYFDLKNAQQIIGAKYYSFPAYSRMRNIYPGYGKSVIDTSTAFIVKGGIHRRDAADLSIERAISAFDDEYIYFSITVADDQVWGGNDKPEANDRVTLWFDMYQGNDRYFLKNAKGGVPNFRTTADSTIYSIVFTMPELLNKTPKITVSSSATMSDLQQEESKKIRGIVERDTANGKVNGYTMKVRIPFTFLGFETNPIGAYENRALENMFDDTKADIQKKRQRTVNDYADYPRFGFTAVVSDVDNPSMPDEITQQATSDFKPNDPSTYGEMLLIPSGEFYGFVLPTYMKDLTDALKRAGY